MMFVERKQKMCVMGRNPWGDVEADEVLRGLGGAYTAPGASDEGTPSSGAVCARIAVRARVISLIAVSRAHSPT